MVTINVPASSGGSSPSVGIPSSVGPQGPAGAPGTRSTDIGFSIVGEVPLTIGAIPVSTTTTIDPDLCLAQASGTGVVMFDLDGAPVGSVEFPSAAFTIVDPVMTRGFLNFTSTGSLSGLSLALAGER